MDRFERNSFDNNKLLFSLNLNDIRGDRDVEIRKAFQGRGARSLT